MRPATPRRAVRRLLPVTLLLLVALVAGLTGADRGGLLPATATAQIAGAAPASVALAATGRAARPNVLVIETDDMRHDDLRFMPNVRRLIQRRGLTFAHSFAPTPLCCPSRASFLTGRYSHNHGVHSHVAPYGFAALDDRSTLATTLRRSGYRTAMVGKYLNGYGYQRLRKHHGRAGATSLRYVPPGWSRWLGGLDRNADPEARTLPRGGTYHYQRLTQNVDGRVVTTRGYSADTMGTQVRSLTRGFDRGSAPWFVWWTPVAPHSGMPAERDDPRRVKGADGRWKKFKTPARPTWAKGRFDRVVKRAPGVPRNGRSEADISDKPGWMQRPEANAAERRALVKVTRQRAESLLALDRQVRLTLQQLQRTRKGRNTIIVFTSDNGYYLGEHRVRQGKRTLLEPSLRVPLLIAGPGVPRGTRYDPATTVDLAPTIASYAGTRMRGADGVDLRPVITGGDRGWTRPVVTETAMTLRGRQAPGIPRSPLTLRGLRLGEWSVTRYANGEVELYDLRRDPLQLRNLARSADHAQVREELLALVAAYDDCRGPQCAVALPAAYAVTAAESRAIARAQERARRAYYG